MKVESKSLKHTRHPKKKKKKKTTKKSKKANEHKAGLGSGRIITILRRQMSIPMSIFSRSSGYGGLVRWHLLVNHFHVQILQVYSRGVFDQVLTDELKALVIPAKEYNVVLFNLLESLDGLSSNGLHLLLCSLELLIFLQC